MSGHTKHLDSFLDDRGRLIRFPAKQKMQAEALAYLAEKFDTSRTYTEREVNELLNEWHTFSDPATLRRGLYNAYYLNRTDDGTRYQAVQKEPALLPSTERDNEELYGLLLRHNRQFNGDQEPFAFHIEQDGKLVAGITACRVLDTMEVEYLCVDEAYRGRGYGTRLLRRIEQLAAEKHLLRVCVWTYSFQAPGFYERLGYERLFTMDPCFGPYQQIFYRKSLGQN